MGARAVITTGMRVQGYEIAVSAEQGVARVHGRLTCPNQLLGLDSGVSLSAPGFGFEGATTVVGRTAYLTRVEQDAGE